MHLQCIQVTYILNISKAQIFNLDKCDVNIFYVSNKSIRKVLLNFKAPYIIFKYVYLHHYYGYECFNIKFSSVFRKHTFYRCGNISDILNFRGYKVCNDINYFIVLNNITFSNYFSGDCWNIDNQHICSRDHFSNFYILKQLKAINFGGVFGSFEYIP